MKQQAGKGKGGDTYDVVIFPLDQWFSGYVVFAFDFGRVEGEVVDSS